MIDNLSYCTVVILSLFYFFSICHGSKTRDPSTMDETEVVRNNPLLNRIFSGQDMNNTRWRTWSQNTRQSGRRQVQVREPK
uniref:Secreted protein n=1 Tax=Cyclopterus lumpus TaxID=8103 RepID=A0A8C2YXU6_CYCLU